MKKISLATVGTIAFLAFVFLSLPVKTDAISCGAHSNIPAYGLDCGRQYAYGRNCVSVNPATSPTTYCSGGQVPNCDTGSCGCPTGQIDCPRAGGGIECRAPGVPPVDGCPTGQDYSRCDSRCTGTRIVELSPPSLQDGYVSVTGAASPTGAPEGSLYYNRLEDKLFVNKGTDVAPNWQDAGGTTYNGVGNIQVSGTSILTIQNPTFSGSVIAGKLSVGSAVAGTNMGDIGLGGNLVVNSGNRIVINQSSVVGADTRLTLGGTVRSDADSIGIGVNAPSTLQNAEVVFGQGGVDKWSLSNRGTSGNFEIWRNVNGLWTGPAPLRISSLDGGVTINTLLNVNSTEGINARKLTLSGGSGNLLNVVGNGSIQGNLAINGTLTGVTTFSPQTFVTSTLDLAGTGAAAISSTGNAGGILRVGSASGNQVLRVSGNEISTTSAGSLNLQAHSTGVVHVYNDLNVDDDLNIDGVITAGSSNVPITSAGGGLKMAELANEDWGAGANPGPKGTLMIGVNSQDGSSPCNTVCQNHGLQCSYTLVIGTTSNSVATGSCGSASGTQGYRLCACGS